MGGIALSLTSMDKFVIMVPKSVNVRKESTSVYEGGRDKQRHRRGKFYFIVFV